MQEPIKVLQFVNVLGTGGIETLVVNWHKYINTSKIQFDYACQSKTDFILHDSILSLGGKINFLNSKNEPSDKSGYFVKIVSFYKLLKSSRYQLVHFHCSSQLTFVYAFVAWLAGQRKLICHSHTSGETNNTNLSRKIISYCFKKLFINLFAKRYACSVDAGKWLYGNVTFEVINNGISVNRFAFQKDKREEIRNSLAIHHQFVVGHIGRFEIAKNHSFLIEVFHKIKRYNNNSKLLLVGTGSLENAIKLKVKSLGLSDDVIFYGYTTSSEELYCSMDVLIFPSLYEGLGITVIESQSSALKTIASNVVPHETNITDNIEYMSLNQSAGDWAKAALKYTNDYERNDLSNVVVNAGFDIKENTDFLIDSYMKLITSRDRE